MASTKRTKFLIESQGGDAAEKALHSLGDTAERASRRVGSSAKEGSKGLRALDGASRGAQDAMEDLARRAGPLGSALTSLGTKGTVAAAGVAAVGIGLGVATGQAVRFETGLINVGKTTNLQGRELDRLGDKIGVMSVELGESSDRLFETAQAAGQLGVTGVDNIALFTETITKLGASSDLVGSQGATALARLLTITGESVDEVDALASVIVRLGNNFATTESEIAETATRVAGATAAFDVSSAQAAAFATTINQVGEQSEAGATQIGKAFRAIATAVDEGGGDLRAFAEIMDVSTGELTQMFRRDAVGAVVAFIEALGAIPAEQLSSQLDRVGLAGERGNRVFGNLAQNSEVLRQTLGAANEEVANATALQEEFARQLEATAKQGARVGSALAESGRLIASPFLPAVRESTTALADMVEQFNELLRGDAPIEDFIAFLEKIPTPLAALNPNLLGLSTAASGVALAFDAMGDSGEEAASRVRAAHQDQLVETFKSLEQLRKNLDWLDERAASTTTGTTEAVTTEAEQQIQRLNARLDAFRSGGLGALQDVTAEQERQAAIDKEVAQLLKDSNVSRERAVELATELVDKETQLNDQVSERERLLKDLQEIGDEAAKAAEDAQERLERRQERQAEELRRRQERQAELLAQPFINAAEGIQDEFSDAIFDIVRDGKLEFEDLGDSILDIFARTFAEVATLRIGMPIIQSGVGGVAGMLGLPAGAQSALSAALPGGGGGLLSQAGGAASLGSAAMGLGGGLTANSLTAGTFSGLMAGGPAQFLGMGSQVGIPGGVGSGFVPSAMGIGVNALGAGALGAVIGGPLAGALGGSEIGGSLGGGLGGAGGAALGQLGMIGALGGPLGALAGAALGTLIGGLVGPSANASHFALRTGSGTFNNNISGESAFGRVGLDARLSDDIKPEFAQNITDTLVELDNQISGLLSDAQNEAVRDALQGTGFRIDANQEISEGEMASVFVDRFQRIFSAIDEELPPALARAAQDLSGNNPDVETAVQSGLGALQDIAAERMQEQQEEQALEAFQQRVSMAILEITDPARARLEAFEREAEARLETAREIGADITEVERLNALERQRIIKDAGSQSNDALERLLLERTASVNATVGTGRALDNAREIYNERLSAVQAGGGDRGALATAADNLIDLQRARFGSSSEFQDRSADVLNQIRGITTGETVDSGMAEQTAVLQDIGAETMGTNERLDDLIAETRAQRAEISELRAELRELEAERSSMPAFNWRFDNIGGFGP